MTNSNSNLQEIGLKSIGNIYDVETKDIAKFIYELFTAAGIEGIVAPVVAVTKEGTGSNIGVATILTIKETSANIRSNKFNNGNDAGVSPVFNQGSKKEKFRPDAVLSKLLVKTARPLYTDDDEPRFEISVGYRNKNKNNRVLTIQLDALRILALMTGADLNQYKIQVMATKIYNQQNGKVTFATIRRAPGSSMADIVVQSILKGLRK